MSSKELSTDVLRIAELLAEGLDDRAVAKIEGITIRTVRRRVARLQRVIGGRTRFHSGFLYAKREPCPRQDELSC